MMSGSVCSGSSTTSLPEVLGRDSQVSIGSIPRSQERTTASDRNGLSQPLNQPTRLGVRLTFCAASSRVDQLNGACAVYIPK